MAEDDDSKLSTGRFARLAKLASMSAKLSTEVVSRGVKRLRTGEGADPASILGPQAAEKLVSTLGDLKGLAMKIGQSIAMDPELLTPEVRAIIGRLQNQAPPMSWATVRQVVTEQLGAPPEKAFKRFSEQPAAAASLGQVHDAETHDGMHVAVKVQYPDVAKALESDLNNVSAMVSVVSASTRMTQGRSFFSELRDGFLEELDYAAEADRLELYAKAAAPFPDLRVPRVVRSLTRPKVLTLEFLQGTTVKEFLNALDTHDNDERFRVSRLLIRAMWGPFLANGVVHADPHPGNFLVLPNGAGLGVLDFGAVKQLSVPWLASNRRLFDSRLNHKRYDPIDESVSAGMKFDDPTKARAFVQTVLDIACRGLVNDDFDFKKAGITRDMKQHMLKNALVAKDIHPPKEAVQFLRATGGMSQNLENIGARGDVRGVFAEIMTTSIAQGMRIDW